ncbi:hypothetical protein Tco_0391005 [Tanacetum coccineum]
MINVLQVPPLDIATATKPQLDKALETLAPYTKEAVIAYGRLVFISNGSKGKSRVDKRSKLADCIVGASCPRYVEISLCMKLYGIRYCL